MVHYNVTILVLNRRREQDVNGLLLRYLHARAKSPFAKHRMEGNN